MYFHFDHLLLLNHSVYRTPEIHDCSPWIPLNIAIPYELLVCIRYTLTFLGLVSFYLSLSPFPTEKVHCRDRDEPVCRCIEKREREREENGRNVRAARKNTRSSRLYLSALACPRQGGRARKTSWCVRLVSGARVRFTDRFIVAHEVSRGLRDSVALRAA